MATVSELRRSTWQTVIVFTLACWLSCSLLLDCVMMPSFYAAGMLSQSAFASGGYLIFGIFNHVEVLCAAVVLTGILVLNQLMTDRKDLKGLLGAGLLLGIVLVYTYCLTPSMSGLGLQLNFFEPIKEVPIAMNQLHAAYWGLELLKLLTGGALLIGYYRDRS